MRTRLVSIVPFLVYLGLTAPFAARPFDIDDPLFLANARQIERDPLRPYDYAIVWDARLTPARRQPNPPLHSYYLAGLRALFGESEVALHLGILPFGILALWAIGCLARRFGVSPWWARLLVAVSPPFVLMSQTVMPDIPLCGLVAVAVAFGVRAIDEGRLRDGLVAGACAGAAAVVRYNALGVMLLLVVYAVTARRPLRRLVPILVLALLPVTAWTVMTWRMDGVPHLVTLLGKAAPGGGSQNPGVNAVTAIVLVGGAGVVPPIWLAAFLADPRWRTWAASLLVAIPTIFGMLCAAEFLYGPQMIPVYPLYLVPGLLLLGLSFASVARVLRGWRSRTPEAAEDLLLVCWLWGMAFAPVLYVHVAAKYLVPALAPLVLLFLRWFRRWQRVLWPAAVALGAAVSVAVAVADHERASVAVRTAEEIAAPLVRAGRTVWNRAEWGFQYYLERVGARPLAEDVLPAPGDLIVYTEYAPIGPPAWPVRNRLVVASRRRFTSSFPVLTMNSPAYAGFYSNGAGWFPFSAMAPPVELEVVTVYEQR